MFVILLKYLLSFDTAKVRRFLKPAMDLLLFFSKKWVSFDLNQPFVCEHTPIVFDNSVKLPLILFLRGS